MAQRNALDYYDSVVARMRLFQGSVEEAYRMIPDGGVEDLRENTSGGVSSRTLRQMGHPYARKTKAATGDTPGEMAGLLAQRRGVSKGYAKTNGLKGSLARASAPLLPINRQSGRLNRSVRIVRVRAIGNGQKWRVYFDRSAAGRSLYAVLPRGTRNVVPRGLQNEVRRRFRIRNRAFRDTFGAVRRRTLARRP